MLEPGGDPARVGLDFSIVIPSYRRPGALGTCLNAIARLDYPRDRFEVVVVDDGSVPPLPRPEGPVAVTLVRQDNAGPAAARNLGASRARGTFLAFTDDDCVPRPDWLSRLGAALGREPEALVGGRTVNALTGNAFASASQALITYLYAYFDADPNRSRFFTSNNMALAAERFRELGGFETGFRHAAGEDRWLCEQWRWRGWPMRYVPEAIVLHSHDLTLRTFWRQHHRYGGAAHHFHRRRIGEGWVLPPPEPWAFYGGLLRYPWTVRHPRPFRQMLLLMLSQVANVAGYFRERIGAGRLD